MTSPIRRLLILPLACLVAACSGSWDGVSGTSGNNNPPPVKPPPAPKDPSPNTSGIVAACAGSGAARLDYELPGAGFEAAVFQGASRSDVYVGAPVQIVTESSLIVTGLTDGVDAFFGLAIRADGATTWLPAGTAVRTRPGAPIYVDAAGDPSVGNGQSAATPFVNLSDALLVAGAFGGANVWVKNGDYGVGPYFLGPNVHCAGGFGAAFDFESRDAAASTTRATASSTQEIFSVISGGADSSLDGIEIDGGNSVLKGVDIVDSDVELRALVISNCIDGGVKAVVSVATQNRRLQIVASDISGNGGDGVSTSGPYDIVFDKCQFDANGQEGVDVDDLNVIAGGASTFRATACRFFGNSFEGLDIDLATIGGAPAATLGTFDVYLEDCSFEVNGLDGLLIDQEHEFFPNVEATVALVGITARANRLAGVHIDADANGTYHLHRIRCTANTTDGLLVTSETNAGEVLVTSSWFAGNLGRGVALASGNKTLLLSQCGVAGNQGGGIVSESVACAIANSVFWLQPAALTNVYSAGNYLADGSEQVFEIVPVVFTTATANNVGALTVASSDGFAVGDLVRVADDPNGLMVTAIAPNTLVLDADPQAFLPPGSVHGYAGSDVVDDLRLVADSPAFGRGIAAAGDPAADAGPFGASNGGEPGMGDPFAATELRVLGTAPALANGVTAMQPLVITFDREVDVATVTSDRVVAIQNGTELVVGLSVSANTITVAPPATGWSSGTTLQLRGGLLAGDGSPLAAAILLPITVL